MTKTLLVALSVFLIACSTASNREGKIVDASSDYCREIRIDRPELYYDICETTGGWEDRDPKGYAKAHEQQSFTGDFVDDFVDGAIDEAVEQTVEGIFDALD